jgi:hypothetical protein
MKAGISEAIINPAPKAMIKKPKNLPRRQNIGLAPLFKSY